MNISIIPTTVIVPTITGQRYMTVGTILTLPCGCWIRRTCDFIDKVSAEGCAEHLPLRDKKHYWRD
jgi:hypothetical protein